MVFMYFGYFDSVLEPKNMAKWPSNHGHFQLPRNMMKMH